MTLAREMFFWISMLIIKTNKKNQWKILDFAYILQTLSSANRIPKFSIAFADDSL